MDRKCEFIKSKTCCRQALFFLFFLGFVNVIFGQKVIQGKIVDEDGLALPAVNVIIKGTLQGTYSDNSGDYKIEIPANISNPTLIFSFIGFNEKEELVGDRTAINVTMISEISKLDELIVTGYSTKRKESLTGALTSVKSDKLKDITTPSVATLLVGKAPGVMAVQSSGQPGAETKVVIRGKTTLNGSTDPLWVIDRVIVGANPGYLNPNDIESVTILKDAASTAIYGSAGSNGVIVVTTKRAKSGDARIEVSSSMAFNSLDRGNLKMMNSQELFDYHTTFDSKIDKKYRDKNFDWFDFGTEVGKVQEHGLTITGGSDKFNIYSSLSYYNEEGAVRGYDLTRLTGRLNIEYKINKFITLRPEINIAKNNIDDRQHGLGALYRNMPWDSPFDEKGNIVNTEDIRKGAWQNVTGTNYYYDLQYNSTSSRTYETRVGFNGDIKLTSDIIFSSTNSYTMNNYFLQSYSDPRTTAGMNDEGVLRNYRYDYFKFFTNQMIKYTKLIDKHFISALAAYEHSERNDSWNDSSKGEVPPGFNAQDAGATNKEIIGNGNSRADQSYLSEIQYDYDKKYLMQLSLRRDGASNFGTNHKYATFYSISGGWNLHNEDFYFLKDVVNIFKLRASYGSTGNRPSDLYPQYGLYSLAPSSTYDEKSGALISQLPNPELSWEKTFTTGIGLDLRFFDRVGLTIDLYNKETSNLLQKAPLPAVVGVTSIWKNVGAVNNKGFEVTISADIIKNKDILWTADINFSLNRNKLKELYAGKELIIGAGKGPAGTSQKILRKGEDIDSWYTYDWAGVNPEDGTPRWYDSEGNFTSNYSKARMTIVGSAAPDYLGGFNTSLSYRGFTLSASGEFVVGNSIYNYTRMEFDSDGAYSDRNQRVLYKDWNRWEKPGDIATHPQPKLNGNNNGHKTSSRYIESGSYFRLRNVTLSYNLPKDLIKFVNMRLYVSGEKLLTITNFSDIDPVVGLEGVADSVYPIPRRFVMGLSLTF